MILLGEITMFGFAYFGSIYFAGQLEIGFPAGPPPGVIGIVTVLGG
jgi:hypothetical protein